LIILVENVTTNLRSLLFPAPHQIMKSNAQSVRNFSPIGNYLPQQYQLDIPTVLQVPHLDVEPQVVLVLDEPVNSVVYRNKRIEI
jgi:hypothetical protein